MTDVYVDPRGNDQATGGFGDPLASIPVALARIGQAGGYVVLAPGIYPRLTDARRRNGATVTIHGEGAATLQGIAILGGTDLVFEGVNSTGQVVLDYAAAGDRLGRPAERISFIEGDWSGSGGSQCKVQNRSQDIMFDRVRIHGCRDHAIVGPGRVDTRYQSNRIAIKGCHFWGNGADGVSFADWTDVTIARCLMEGVKNSDNPLHPDAVQVMGRASRIVIRENTMRSYKGQTIMAQVAVGPVDDLTIEGNVMGDNYAVACHIMGVRGVKARRNVIVGSKDGALWLRRGENGYVPVDAEVTGNVLHCTSGKANAYRKMEGAQVALEADNVILAA